MLSDVADLVLGRACLACGAIGPELCAECLAGLRGRVLVRDHPAPAMVAAGPYAGFLGTAVLAYKQDGHRGLARPLGILLADALDVLSDGGRRPLTIVPIPSHRRPARGFDALAGIVRSARRDLVSRGRTVQVVAALSMARDYGAIKGLGRVERRRQVDGALVVRRTSGIPAVDRVIVVDDVITTGATCAEAVRALRTAGLAVAGVAAVAVAQPG